MSKIGVIRDYVIMAVVAAASIAGLYLDNRRGDAWLQYFTVEESEEATKAYDKMISGVSKDERERIANEARDIILSGGSVIVGAHLKCNDEAILPRDMRSIVAFNLIDGRCLSGNPQIHQEPPP